MRLPLYLSLLLLFSVLMTLPSPAVWAETVVASETPGTGIGDLWRDLDAAGDGSHSVGETDTSGESWRQVQNRLLASWGGWLMAGVLLLIAAFYAIRGPISMPRGDDTTKVQRYSPYQRITHWFVTILFLLLTVSGLILLYGENLLQPLFGVGGYAAMASGAKAAHILFGPLFLLGLLLMIVSYFRDNLPRRADIDWFASGGGYFGRHASAHLFNGGEKAWFWLLSFCGLGLSVSGLLLTFTFVNLGQLAVEFMHFIHVAFGFVLIAAALGHTYLATVGIEGALQGMVHGSVERRWAAQHHDLWLEEIESAATETEDKP